MASISECRVALEKLSTSMRRVDASTTNGALPRTVSCGVRDLDLVFTGTLDTDGFRDVTTESAPPAQIRLDMTSDDLVALSEGNLDFASSWIRGRIKVHASFGDLLRLRHIF